MMIKRLKNILPYLSLMVLIYVFVSFCSEVEAKPREIDWDSLDLSSQQRDQINQQDEQWRSAVSEAAPRIQMKERKLKKMMSSPQSDEQEILRLQQDIHEEKARLKMEATRIFLNKRKVLKRDQQQKLQNIINLH
jgi:hypothetical protein